MTVNVELFDDLDAVAADAGGALGRHAQPLLFDRLDWFRLLERDCPPEGKLTALRAEAGGRRAWLFLALDHPQARPYTAWYSLRFSGTR